MKGFQDIVYVHNIGFRHLKDLNKIFREKKLYFSGPTLNLIFGFGLLSRSD